MVSSISVNVSTIYPAVQSQNPGVKLLPVEMGSFTELQEKCICGPTHGRLKCWNKIYWDRTGRLPPGS